MPAKCDKFAVDKSFCFNLPTATVGDTYRRQLLRREELKMRGLRMIRLASEIGVQDLLAVRFVVVLVGNFSGNEDRIDLS